MSRSGGLSRGVAGWISAVGALALIALAVAPSACSTSTLTIGQEVSDAGSTPALVTADASQPDAGDAAIGACPTNECPAGRATCANNPFPCAVDVLSDDDNCGACGNACPVLGGRHASMTCANGTCALKCEGTYFDCNGHVEDGCEVDIGFDNDNCGGCGVVCPANHRCSFNECVCDVWNSCGACGNVCPWPYPDLPMFPWEWNADYRCVNNVCNQATCNPGWADCNNDFNPSGTSGDGCETSVRDDSQNCGGCGVACGAGEECYDGQCVCRCGGSCFNKLDYDTRNCGACGVACREVPGGHGEPVCDHGVCGYRCFGSHADCDDDLANGCETNILDDPLNCGGCGIRCDGVEGQACVEGRCTVKECTVR